jgi:hypothetical protein
MNYKLKIFSLKFLDKSTKSKPTDIQTVDVAIAIQPN